MATLAADRLRRRRLGEERAGGRTVDVKLTDAGCDPGRAPPRGRAGDLRGRETTAPTRLTEFEILDGDRTPRRGRERRAGALRALLADARSPGTSRCTAPAGRRSAARSSSPGGVREDQRGRGRGGRPLPPLPRGPDGALVARTTRGSSAELRAGDRRRRRRPLRGRPASPTSGSSPWRRASASLDPAIDARAGRRPGAKWTGFHPIEQDAVGRRDDRRHRRACGEARPRRRRSPAPRPDDRAPAGAGRQRRRSSCSARSPESKITGEEERYSHLDLVDFEANVDGARGGVRLGAAARGCPQPGARRSRRPAVRRVDAVLRPYRRGSSFVSYTALTQADTRKLSRAIDALAEPLSQVAAIVARHERSHDTRPAARGRGGRCGCRAGRGRLERLATDGERELRTLRVVPFYGERQAGITTPAQDRLHFAAFDVVTESRSDLRGLLRAWTEASARMCAGEQVGPNAHRLAPPIDTGEALGLSAARLTVTFGFGPTLFDRFGLGLGSKRPAELAGAAGVRRRRPRSRSAPAATSRYRRAPTTRRSRSTPSATWPGSAAVSSSCAGRSSASGGRRRPAGRRRRRAT